MTSPSVYLPLLSCIFGLAPACKRDSAICAISAMTSGKCFLGLYDATRCRGVSWSPNVAAFTRAPFLMRKFAANLSPFCETKQGYLWIYALYALHNLCKFGKLIHMISLHTIQSFPYKCLLLECPSNRQLQEHFTAKSGLKYFITLWKKCFAQRLHVT